MSKNGSVGSFIAKIRKINARFRKLKKKDGPFAARLAMEKDRLIDEAAAICPHPEVIATRGAKASAARKFGVSPRRICPRCGCCEARLISPFAALAGRPARYLSVDDYRVAEGSILKKLGINL